LGLPRKGKTLFREEEKKAWSFFTGRKKRTEPYGSSSRRKKEKKDRIRPMYEKRKDDPERSKFVPYVKRKKRWIEKLPEKRGGEKGKEKKRSLRRTDFKYQIKRKAPGKGEKGKKRPITPNRRREKKTPRPWFFQRKGKKG